MFGLLKKLCCCAAGTAGCPCSDDVPGIKVTVSWTDMASTKNLFGVTWSNGETKTLCPDTYQCTCDATMQSRYYCYQRWLFGTAIASTALRLAASAGWTSGGPTRDRNNQRLTFRLKEAATQATLKRYRYYSTFGPTTGGTQASANLSTNNFGANGSTNFSGLGSVIEANHFGQATDVNGVTVAWQKDTDNCSSEWAACDPNPNA